MKPEKLRDTLETMLTGKRICQNDVCAQVESVIVQEQPKVGWWDPKPDVVVKADLDTGEHRELKFDPEYVDRVLSTLTLFGELVEVVKCDKKRTRFTIKEVPDCSGNG